MAKKEKIQIDIEDGAVGSEIECYVRVENVRYPKKNLEDIEYGENGIIKLFSEDVIKGKFPEQLVMPSFFSKSDKIEAHFIAKGRLPKLDLTSIYYFKGVLVEDPRFGLQYTIEEFHKVYNLKAEETEIFLRAIYSEHRAQLLIDNFIDPLLPLKEGDINSLTAIPGIGYATAEAMIKTYQDNFETGTSYVQLAEFGLTPGMINTLQKSFKSVDTILYVLQNDPYCLIDIVDGVGWKKADAIAANSGYIELTGEKRVKAYVKFFLKECANNYGHSWVDLNYLITAVQTEMPELQIEDLLNMLRSWKEDTEDGRKAWLYYDRESNRIGLNYYRQVEERLAKQFIRLKHENAKVYSNEEIEKGIAKAEENLGFQYTEEQREAIKNCLTNGVTIISGSAGVGKTSIMKAVVQVLKDDNRVFYQCSLSGKASSNLTEVTGEEGMTIHRLLSYLPDRGYFFHNAEKPIPADAIIVDELSLIGGELFLNLLEALPKNCRLICLGDEKQLESIGMANLLKDCINAHVLPAQRLIKIHRQAAKSGIITESLRASAQEQIVTHTPGVDIRGELQDFKIISSIESQDVADNFVEEYRRLHFDEHISVQDIMGVSPLRDKTNISCLALNKRIQALINPIPKITDVHVGSEDKGYILREKDKILVIKNNYQTVNADAVVDDPKNAPKIPIYNGNTGFIDEINKEQGYLVIRLLQGRVKIPFNEVSYIELGYVITAHKSQGSGSPYVIVALTMQAYSLLSKEWIYTALTRAKKYCTLCTQISAARQAVTISRVQIKHTWLQELLIEYEKGYQTTKVVPIYDWKDKLTNYIGRSKEIQIAYDKAEKKREIGDMEAT